MAAGETERDVILEFKPDGLEYMLIACLWSRWQAPGQPDLLSFAAVTDEPPPEVGAAESLPGSRRSDNYLDPRRPAPSAWARLDHSDLNFAGSTTCDKWPNLS